MLGQEQDSVGGGFEAQQSLQGMISNVNVWDRILDPDRIKEMSAFCLPVNEDDNGNVHKWFDILREGETRLMETSSCEPFEKGVCLILNACTLNRLKNTDYR